MVASHGKLGVLLFYHEIVKVVLLRKLVTQAHSVIVYAESQGDVAVGRWLVKVNLQFVVIVSDGLCFSPNRCPSLIERCGLRVCLLESVHKVGLLHTF